MSVEVATYVNSLDSANPLAGDPASQGDDHLRLLKSVLKATFPGGDSPNYTNVAELTVASATSTNALGAASDKVAISGTTTIAGLGTGVSRYKFIRFTGALTLTHNATSLILPGGADITTAAGDTMFIVSDASSNVRVLAYQRANGLPLDADLVALASLDATGGLLARTGAAAFARRTLTAGIGISISDGDGVATNPIISGSFPVPPGRLTMTSTLALAAADVLAATQLYYTPVNGNLFPYWTGSLIALIAFSELTLSLNNPSHVAKSIYDVFGAIDTGALIVGTGPAWTNPGNYISAGTLTTGTAARGSGAGTTELERKGGLWVNKNAITLRNGATTYSIAANQATYLGSIWMDATAGQLSCHVSYGQNRKFGLWNAYNRLPIEIVAGDTTTSWSYGTATWRAARAQTANAISVLCGLPEEIVSAEYAVRSLTNNGEAINAVGFNSTSATPGGRWGFNGPAGGGNPQSTSSTAIGILTAQPYIGLNAFIAMENGNGATASWSSNAGGQSAMQLRTNYRG